MYESIEFEYGGKFSSRGKWCHPVRVCNSSELIIVLEGNVHIAVEDDEYHLSVGDILFIKKGEHHGGIKESRERISFYWLHFTGDDNGIFPSRLIRPVAPYQAELIARQILHYANTEGYPRASADYLLRVLLMELSHVGDVSGDRICSAVREWIRINCDLPLKVTDVAIQFGYNADYLNRLFRITYPEGLKAYINQEKMESIKRDLLKGSLTLSDIAAKYAFLDYKYFLKYFKYHEGISPQKYRALYYNLHTNNH